MGEYSNLGAGIGSVINPIWGTAIGYTIGSEADYWKKFSNNGGSGLDYLKYRMYGTSDLDEAIKHPFKNVGARLKNLLDPFGQLNIGGKDVKKEAPKIAGKTQDQWVDELGMSDQDLQNYYAELSQELATQGSESRNRVDDVAARENLPAATQLAAERGVQQNQMEATQKGMTALEQMQTEANRRAQQIVLQMFGNKEANSEAFARAQEAYTQQQMNQMMASLGEMLAQKYLGNGFEQSIGDGYYVTKEPGTTYEPYKYW